MRLSAQNTLDGVILEANSDQKTIPLAGANVYWLHTTVGVVTGLDGEFSIPYKPEYKKLVISYVGYK